MQDRTRLQERYLQDDLPTRLGGLAANLARIPSFSHHVDNQAAVERLIEESKLFIEWTASEIDIDSAAELVAMQIQLARWQRNWRSLWADPAQRVEMADQAKVWSERVLELSGILSGGIASPEAS
ncbi:MAG: hypothetical protein HC772_13835 [Leptolyngbyaceae cyanobacterium CRU_2_3]|nr:hypothetical protein [Leptolyngbyaceae cyanobacterium CRU_2_3]